jgi:hypothetical protein
MSTASNFIQSSSFFNHPQRPQRDHLRFGQAGDAGDAYALVGPVRVEGLEAVSGLLTST